MFGFTIIMGLTELFDTDIWMTKIARWRMRNQEGRIGSIELIKENLDITSNKILIAKVVHENTIL